MRSTFVYVVASIVNFSAAINSSAEVVSRLTRLLEQYVANGRSTSGVQLANDVPVGFEGAVKKKAKK